MNRDEVTELGEGRGTKLIGTEPQVVTPRPSSLLKDQGRGGRAYLPRPGRGRDEVGTRGRGSSETRPGGQPSTAPAPDLVGSRRDDYSSNEWRNRAACRGLHTVFDPRTDNEDRASVTDRHERAIRICNSLCPVIAECRAFVRSSPRRFRQGVLAGHLYVATTSKESDND
jgi:hypothetical protein